jgi:hypothetical protein
MLGTRTHSEASAAQYTPSAKQSRLNENGDENSDERESKRINRGTQTGPQPEVSSEQAAASLAVAASKLCANKFLRNDKSIAAFSLIFMF